jgi:hypothetical protein
MDTRLILPADLKAPVDEAIARAVGERWASRMWARDTRLWAEDPTVGEAIAERLGWLDVPTVFEAEVAELTAFGEEIEREGFRDAVVLGVGGIALAAEALDGVYPAETDKGLRVHVLDSTDPAAIASLDGATDPERTLYIVATKSGTTTETIAFLAHFWATAEHRVGRFRHTKAGNGFVSISDPGAALGAIPHHDLFRESFLVPADVDSQYSALTYVGLVPGALMRLDLDPLLEDARIMARQTQSDADDNPALVLGAALAALARHGRDKLTFVIEPDLAPLGPWIEQLIAVSTGKAGRGIIPVDGESLGAPEVYGRDRVFVRLGPGSDVDWHRDVDGRLAALTAAGHPLIDIRLDDASWVGAEFFRWQFAAAVAAVGLGVDPFDEPDIGESHEGMTQALEAFAAEGHLPEVAAAAMQGRLSVRTQVGEDGRPRDAGDVVAALREHLQRAPDGGYLQIGAWFAPSGDRTAGLRAIQSRLRDTTRRATTIGYGPRYLHSTGQLHKGGPPTGCFIQLIGGPVGGEADVPIPGRDETFGVLLRAQALGDLGALTAHHLPTISIDLGEDVDAGLDQFAAALDEALA